MATADATWWEEMFTSPDWQDVQLGWSAVEDAAEQTDRIEEALRLQEASDVLDVPCGTGRIAIELAERGHRVTGVDLIERFVEAGRARAEERGVAVDLRAGDMRTLEAGVEAFDAGLCFWGSFGYFTDAEDSSFAGGVCRALRPGGQFLIDTPVAETVMPRFRPRDFFQVGDVRVLMEATYVPGTGRIENDWTFVREGAAASTRHTSMRLYTLRELTELLRAAGFTGFEARDDALAEFELGSQRLWLVATK